MISAMDKNDLKITKAKAQADEKYFSLFEKHIPVGLADDSRVLLYALGNIDCIYKIISKNPRAEYFIYDSKHIVNAVKLICDEVRIFKSVDMYDIDMKFDCIIMNPPYERNLHLKILAEAIKHLKDDKSRCVNLSPDNWLTNPYKMFEHERIKKDAVDDLGTHIDRYHQISANDFNQLFSTSSWFGVGIFSFKKSKTSFNVHQFDTHNSLMVKLLKAITPLKSLRSQFIQRTAAQGFVPVRRTNHGYLNWCEFENDKIKSKDGIQFKTVEEANNFKSTTINTFLYKFLSNSDWEDGQNSAAVPWMGDSINPRTGLKGYESEWTDDDFYKFFNITDDEKKIIEDTMAKYAK